MPGPALLINTHPQPNPDFINPLAALLEELELEYRIISAYEDAGIPAVQPGCVVLSGVPREAAYSLSEPENQQLIESRLGWLKGFQRPVLGICYGHQITAHLLGGTVSQLPEPVINPDLEIQLSGSPENGVFQGFYRLKVFAEHRDYVSRVPHEMVVLSSRGSIPYLTRHPGREWYGCQFVPERSGAHTQKILRRFFLLNVR